jgi:hypothetical protein
MGNNAMDDELIVRVSVVGHASRRWKSAKNAVQADRLNQRLSELRATNVRRAVEAIIRRELPTLKIDVPSRGVGRHEPFPTASENNAAVDRSVLFMVELTTTRSTLRSVHRPPRKIFAATRLWTLTVAHMLSTNTVGVGVTFLRVRIRNGVTGKEITLAGTLAGGALSLNPYSKNKNPLPFKADVWHPRSHWQKPVGQEVTFLTSKPMDFGDWIGAGQKKGQSVRLVHAHVKTGLTKTATTFLQFRHVDHDPDMLVFELAKFKFSPAIPNVENTVLAGELVLEGDCPSDFIEVPGDIDLVRIQQTNPGYDGLLVTFPTGKADLRDVTVKERKELTDFVTNKARAIAAFAHSYKVANPRP